MLLDTYKKVGAKTAIDIPERVLSNLHCGLFRASYEQAFDLMPELSSLFYSTPFDGRDFEFDVKIHMLMPEQYPCIPNWHCDNVPRDSNGLLDYSRASGEHLMFLWVSGGPLTQFLSRMVEFPGQPKNHGDVSEYVKQLAILDGAYTDKPILASIPPQQWVSMSQLTPHRGVQSQQNQWRVFCRATHKSICPSRPVTSVIRRHAQVYLDASRFTW